MNLPPNQLDELLNRALAAPEPPPDLLGKLRRRLAASPAAGPSWWTRLDVVFGRPSFAAAFVAACVLLGLFLAEARLARWHAARGTEIARRYSQLIDPLLSTDTPPAPSSSP